MKLVVFGLSLSSSWGNGHATTYRSLLRAFAGRGHEVTFYEWDAPWYRGANRDLPKPDFAELILYESWDCVRDSAIRAANEADATLVGSFVRDGAGVIDDLAAADVAPLYFYDIDTPVTVSMSRSGGCEYLRRDQVALFDCYLSFTGGPFLQDVLIAEFGARDARALYCSVDVDQYEQTSPDSEFVADLAYMGTYAADRQPTIEKLLIDVARRLPERRFLVAGPQYPAEMRWPSNVRRIEHVPQAHHAAFYSSARWQLNATRREMILAGWSPSVRLFEAGAAGAAILSDDWPGIDQLFTPGVEVLLPDTTDDVVEILSRDDEEARIEMGRRMRQRIVEGHSGEVRATELERYIGATVQGRR